jgi:hypothetical protein
MQRMADQQRRQDAGAPGADRSSASEGQHRGTQRNAAPRRGVSQRQGALGSSQGDAGAREAEPVLAPPGSDAPQAGADPRTGAPPGQRGKIGTDAANERASDRAGIGATSHRQGDGTLPTGNAPSAERDDPRAKSHAAPGTVQNTSSSGRRGGR